MFNRVMHPSGVVLFMSQNDTFPQMDETKINNVLKHFVSTSELYYVCKA